MGHYIPTVGSVLKILHDLSILQYHYSQGLGYLGVMQEFIIHPKPLNPKPLNPKTLNPKPQTLNIRTTVFASFSGGFLILGLGCHFSQPCLCCQRPYLKPPKR